MARHFKASHDTTVNELKRLIAKMGATNLRIEQDYHTHEAVVSFDRKGRRYAYRNKNYSEAEDNLRSIRLVIEHVNKASEYYGVSQTARSLALDDLLAGVQAVPGDGLLRLGAGQWWEVLDVPQNADRKTVDNAFRALARFRHPDAGGDPEEFVRVQRAYNVAIGKG